MRELAKSLISFSWALGLAGARGVASLANPDRREKFLSDSERLLRQTTDETVDTLGRDLRETFRFGDEFQRRAIDAGLAAATSLFSQKAAKYSAARASRPKDDSTHGG